MNPNLTTKKIRRRLFVYLATSLLILTFGLMTVISLTMFKEMEKAADNNLAHTCEIRSMTVAEWCRRAKDLARQITSRTRIRQELEKYNQAIVSREELTSFTNPKLRDAMNLSEEIIGITRLDKQGRIVAQCGEDPVSLNLMPLQHYIDDKTKIFVPCPEGTCRFVIVSAPIMDYSGRRQGNDIVIFKTDDLQKIIVHHSQLGSYESIAIGYIIDEEPLALIVSRRDSLNPAADKFSSETATLMTQAIAGQKGLKHLDNLVASFRPIEECNWGIVITQHTTELYRSLYNRILILYLLSFAIYLLVLGGFWLALRPLAGKILLYSSELEKRIKDKTEHLNEEIEERKKAEAEKQRTIVELQDALNNIKILKGLIPICASCKKIRDDQGFWSQFEEYIKKHSDADFSHGICPECLKKYYPEVLDESETGKE